MSWSDSRHRLEVCILGDPRTRSLLKGHRGFSGLWAPRQERSRYAPARHITSRVVATGTEIRVSAVPGRGRKWGTSLPLVAARQDSHLETVELVPRSDQRRKPPRDDRGVSARYWRIYAERFIIRKRYDRKTSIPISTCGFSSSARRNRGALKHVSHALSRGQGIPSPCSTTECFVER